MNSTLPLSRSWAAYIRVSRMGDRDEDSERFHSIEQQRSAVTHSVAPDRVDFERVDTDATGTNTDREGLQAVLAWVREDPRRRGIAVYDLSRLSRSLTDTLALVAELEDLGAGFASASERVDTVSPAGRFQLQVISAVAEMQARTIGDRWKDILDRRVSRGVPMNGGDRWGYTRTPDGAYMPAERESAFVIEAYSRHNAGEGFANLVRWLNASGSRTLKGNPWSITSLMRVMDAGFAAGFVRERTTHALVPGTQPPLITADTWAIYLAERKRRERKRSRSNAPKSYLSGLVHCGRCGAPAFLSSATAPKRVYRCSTYMTKGKDECPGIFLSGVLVDTRVAFWLGARLHRIAEVLRENDDTPALTARLAALENELETLDTAHGRLATGYASGILDEKGYRLARSDLDDKIRTLRAEADAVREERARRTPLDDDDFAVLESQRTDMPPEVWRRVIARVLDRIVIYPESWEIRDVTGDVVSFPR